jgi:UDP-N-acetylglucosamine acyltransferase
MTIAQSARIHSTAVIAPEAELGEEVQVDPHVVIEGEVHIGRGCVLRPGAHLIGPLTMGCHNTVYSGAVLGERPQHLQYAGEPTRLVIGDHNVIREHVTIHRGTTKSWETRIGNHNFLMANAHVAHDCRIGDHCILANGALMGGHAVLENNVYLSGNCALHQFVRVGRLALLSGVSAATKDIPPFIIQQRINCVVGVNVVGMRRAGIPTAHIDAVRRAFHLLYRSHMLIPAALSHIERDLGEVAEIAEMVAFIRASSRGIVLQMDREAAA